MVEREPAARGAAVDAAPAVAGEERPAGDLPLDRPRDADVVDRAGSRAARRSCRSPSGAAGRAARSPPPCPCRGARGRAEPCTHSAARSWRSGPEPAAPCAERYQREPSDMCQNEPSLRGHRALDRFELLRREGDRGAAAVDLLHVDPRVVAALDRAQDDAACGPSRASRPRPTGGRPSSRRRRSGRSPSSRPSRRRGGRPGRARPTTSSTARCSSSIRLWSETAKSTRS